MDLNVNNLSVDRNGRVSFSGLGSNIDFQGVVDSIIAAKRIPIDRLETEVSSNESKIAALGDLRTMMTSLKDSLSTLHGAVSFNSVNDAFENKEAFASASRTDGATASTATNLIGVTVTNNAPVGNHSLEILQTAKAHKVASDQFNSKTAAIGFTNGDSFSIATTDANDDPVDISFNVTDTMNLLGLRDQINAANKGTSATNVSASIVSVSDSEHYLVLTNDETGADISFTETSGTPLQTIGVFDTGSAFKNQLQASQTAQMYADGILDQSDTIYETDYQTAATAAAATGGTLEFFDGGGASIGTVGPYVDGADLTTIAGQINGAGLGITATVVTDGSGVRMEISSGAAFTMTDTGSAVTDLGIDNKRRVIERTSNTVDDLFAGVTVSLFQAEVGTTINLDIERNLNEIKTAVSTFTDSYNELRRFINDQRTLVEIDDEDETVQSGILYSSEALEQADSRLSAIIGAGVAGVGSNFSVLAQIGIDFIPLGSEADPLDANTLEIDEAALDEALLNNVEDIRRLFSFDFTPSDPRVSLLGFNGNTQYNSAGFTVNIQPGTGTNQLQYSEQLDDAYWTSTRSEIFADQIAGPFGGTTAEGLVGESTSNTHFLTTASPVTVTSGESYTYSVYAQQGANDSARIQLAGVQFPSQSYIDVDLNAGTLTDKGLGVDGYDIEDAGNGWYRISVTSTASATGNATMEMYSMNGINTVYTGDGDGAGGGTVDSYFYGAQLEPSASNSAHVDSFTAIRSSTAVSAVDDPYNSGNFGATAIIADTNNADHVVTNGGGATVTSGETYEFSAYMKIGDRDRARLSLSDGSSAFGANTNVDVDLNAGTILATGAGADSAAIEDVGNGWYRVTLTATAAATSSTVSTEIRPVDATTGLSFIGDDVTASTHVYDAKLVAQSAKQPSAYVATTDTPLSNVTGSANIGGTANGADDGSVTVSGNSLTIQTGDAEGLQLFFSDLSGPTTITFDYTVGVGAQMFYAIDGLLNESTGRVETEIDGLTDTNEISQDRITEMLARLDIQRRSLLERFIAMETAMATNARILASVQASADSLNSSGN